MRKYRAHFLTHGDKVFGVAHFEATDDELAKVHASKTLSSGIGKGYQIWEDNRLVHTETYK